MTKRPNKLGRQKLEDRLISPSAASPNEVACDLALGSLDRVAREMDRKWGVDRLPDLVSPEMAAKYGSAMGKLNAGRNNPRRRPEGVAGVALASKMTSGSPEAQSDSNGPLRTQQPHPLNCNGGGVFADLAAAAATSAITDQITDQNAPT